MFEICFWDTYFYPAIVSCGWCKIWNCITRDNERNFPGLYFGGERIENGAKLRAPKKTYNANNCAIKSNVFATLQIIWLKTNYKCHMTLTLWFNIYKSWRKLKVVFLFFILIHKGMATHFHTPSKILWEYHLGSEAGNNFEARARYITQCWVASYNTVWTIKYAYSEILYRLNFKVYHNIMLFYGWSIRCVRIQVSIKAEHNKSLLVLIDNFEFLH